MGYITEGGTYSMINSTLTETVEGARTVEALGLQDNRVRANDTDIALSARGRRYTMALRNILFTLLGFAYDTPVIMVLSLGAVGYLNDWVTLGQITAAVLYAGGGRTAGEADPQRGPAAGRHRLDQPAAGHRRGAPGPGDRRYATGRRPAGRSGPAVRVPGRSRCAPRRGRRHRDRGAAGDRAQWVGQVDARPTAVRDQPAADRLGDRRRGGTGRVAAGLLRTEVALVTQEHHVFVGSVRDNIILARESSPDSVVIEALKTVEAWDWVERLPRRLDTLLGSGNTKLTPAQAQQIALARLVVADPHTLVLDEATSLIDPHTARHLEGRWPRCCWTAPWWRSPTGCTRPMTPTGSRW